MQDTKCFLRYGLNKVKNIVIFSNLKYLEKYFRLKKRKQWLVDINKIYICSFYLF